MKTPTDSLRWAGEVERYHTWPTLKKQTIADHTWHVMRIWMQLFGTPNEGVVEAIMFHDVGEVRTGDIPYPTKAQHPGLKAAMDELEHDAVIDLTGILPTLDSTDKIRMKVCDLLEMWEFGRCEQAMGNTLAREITERTAKHVGELAGKLPEGERLRVEKFVYGGGDT